MRVLTPIWLAILASFPLLAAAANSCTPSARIPGTPIDAPHAIFEAYVVEVEATRDSSTTFGILRTHRALVEVVRSYHGPYSPGQQVETFTIENPNVCGDAVKSGEHVMVRSAAGGPFEIIETIAKGERATPGPFATLALVDDEPHHSRRRSLRNVSLRGEIDDGLAAQFRDRARLSRSERCDIASAGNYAQVSWGEAFGGNDARDKVIFERVAGEWVEILRYEAPLPTPARDRAHRSGKRTLWAEGSGVRHPDVASAATTS